MEYSEIKRRIAILFFLIRVNVYALLSAPNSTKCQVQSLASSLASGGMVSERNHNADRLRANATNGYRWVILTGKLILQREGLKA